jgi:hypothetical protein
MTALAGAAMKAVAQRHDRIVVDTSVVCRIVNLLESLNLNNHQTILKWRQFQKTENVRQRCDKRFALHEQSESGRDSAAVHTAFVIAASKVNRFALAVPTAGAIDVKIWTQFTVGPVMNSASTHVNVKNR